MLANSHFSLLNSDFTSTIYVDTLHARLACELATADVVPVAAFLNIEASNASSIFVTKVGEELDTTSFSSRNAFKPEVAMSCTDGSTCKRIVQLVVSTDEENACVVGIEANKVVSTVLGLLLSQ